MILKIINLYFEKYLLIINIGKIDIGSIIKYRIIEALENKNSWLKSNKETTGIKTLKGRMKIKIMFSLFIIKNKFKS